MICDTPTQPKQQTKQQKQKNTTQENTQVMIV
jgi:hypothetical protein